MIKQQFSPNFECVAIANAKNALRMEVNETDLYAGHRFSTRAVFCNAAGKIVAHLKKTLKEANFLDEMNKLVPDHLKKTNSSDEEEDYVDESKKPDVILKQAFQQWMDESFSLNSINSSKLLVAIGDWKNTDVESPESCMTVVERALSKKVLFQSPPSTPASVSGLHDTDDVLETSTTRSLHGRIPKYLQVLLYFVILVVYNSSVFGILHWRRSTIKLKL
jgi:hypothetical protein